MSKCSIKDLDKIIGSTVLNVISNEDVITIKARSLMGKLYDYVIISSSDGKMSALRVVSDKKEDKQIERNTYSGNTSK